jgi:hypothetical protein
MEKIDVFAYKCDSCSHRKADLVIFRISHFRILGGGGLGGTDQGDNTRPRTLLDSRLGICESLGTVCDLSNRPGGELIICLNIYYISEKLLYVWKYITCLENIIICCVWV